MFYSGKKTEKLSFGDARGRESNDLSTRAIGSAVLQSKIEPRVVWIIHVFPRGKSFCYLSGRKITMEYSIYVVQSSSERAVSVNFLKARKRTISIKCGRTQLGLSLWTEVGFPAKECNSNTGLDIKYDHAPHTAILFL